MIKCSVLNTGLRKFCSSHMHIRTVGMPQSMVKVYERLQEGLENAVKSCDSLNDPQFKKYRFDLQKAVSTPVNAISAQSGEHLYDKIMRLRRLLSGQPVQVAGKTLNIKSHPAARLYCVNLLAKKIVVSTSPQVYIYIGEDFILPLNLFFSLLPYLFLFPSLLSFSMNTTHTHTETRRRPSSISE